MDSSIKYRAEVYELLSLPGLLSDRQIRQLCEDEKMITPFVDKSQRQNGVISYGLSSYGYDARLAPKYQLFTNTECQLIDPKNPNSGIYVEKDGPSCIIPPNGFMLGHTVETFRIPRDVLVICLGKSTYARCFTADTTVQLYDGTIATFTELLAMQNASKPIIGVSVNPETGEYVNNPLTQIRQVTTAAVVQITFSDGSSCRVTPDHEFLTQTDAGIVKTAAQDLTPSTKLVRMSYHNSETISVKTVFAQVQPQPVYCLTEREFNNFSLGNGVFVSNCACIVNVTPLEPGWEGQVTLELSNTASLPLKVYGNEGICQFLFFRGGIACETSYRDKLGKYMHQTGITHARVEM